MNLAKYCTVVLYCVIFNKQFTKYIYKIYSLVFMVGPFFNTHFRRWLQIIKLRFRKFYVSKFSKNVMKRIFL
jgi:hypothetical protein